MKRRFHDIARIGLCLALGLMFAPALQAAPALSQLSSRLGQANSIHADFEQTKTLQALKRPLKTSGRMVFARKQGVLWTIEKPYQATYALTNDTVVEIAGNGNRKVRSAREVPALAQVGKVFQAIFQGDLQALEAHFEVSVSGDSDRWRVDLIPKPALQRFLKSISALGGRYLEHIEVEEAQGDRTRIEFSDSRLNAPLSEIEAHLLKP